MYFTPIDFSIKETRLSESPIDCERERDRKLQERHESGRPAWVREIETEKDRDR